MYRNIYSHANSIRVLMMMMMMSIVHCTNSRRGKREAHRNWSMVLPGKKAEHVVELP